MEMIKVYVAGAYSADNIIDCLKNIGRGESYSALIFKLGFAPFCPWHDKDFVIKNWEMDHSVDQFYEYSMEWLNVSDCLFLVPGWENSKGTMKELNEAEVLGLPVFNNTDNLVTFYKKGGRHDSNGI